MSWHIDGMAASNIQVYVETNEYLGEEYGVEYAEGEGHTQSLVFVDGGNVQLMVIEGSASDYYGLVRRIMEVLSE
jgi:hypothetical protein